MNPFDVPDGTVFLAHFLPSSFFLAALLAMQSCFYDASGAAFCLQWVILRPWRRLSSEVFQHSQTTC